MAEKPESFGEFLRREREARGISREELCRVTRISKFILDALETDDYRFLPQETFVRGYLRNYARELNLPLEEIMRRFEQFRSGIKPPEKKAAEDKKKPEAAAGSLWIRLGIAGLVLLLGGGAIFSWLSGREKPAAAVKSGGGVEEITAPLAVSYPAETETFPPGSSAAVNPAPGPGVPPLDGAEVPLIFLSREEVWVKFSIDGGEAQEVLLRPGETYKIKGQQNFDLLIGNAGGIELIFNGKPLPALGSSGRVVHLRLPVPNPEG
ncbi:MAG: helix-turn-helix domain-containing protein [Proteobacteria bacterium]|nr:helix-turn-helix domain-containing protein [Pseudomonadota bacterium]